jgi:hypothetical protein
MRERERRQPPQDQSAEALTPVLSLRAPNVLSLRAPNELNPHTKEREQSLAHELNLRAPNEERVEALDPEKSLRAADQVLPSQAGTEPLKWTTMSANQVETVVINPLALQVPTTTFELNPRTQAKLDAIKMSRLDATYSAPEGMGEWQRMNPGKTTSEWIIWRNHQKAAAAIAKNREVKLPPFETRPFNYARVKEDEATQFHVLSFEGNKGDDNTVGSVQEGDNQEEIGNEHFISLEDNLGNDLDRMLNSSSSLSPVNGTIQNHEQDEDELVDYDEEYDEEDFIQNERVKTMSAKTFADNHTEVEAHDNSVAEDEDKLGDEDFAPSESRERSPEGQPKEKDREDEA